MKKIGHALCRAVLISPLVFFALFSLALAQNKELNSKQQGSLQASDKVITITLKMSDNRVITVSQYDGEMVRTGPKEGEKLGITPHILDDGSVALDFFRITKIIRKGVVVGEATINIGSLELNSPFPQATPINLISSLQLISISKDEEESRVRINLRPQCPCCVTCDGQECCGLSVQMSCGSCSCM